MIKASLVFLLLATLTRSDQRLGPAHRGILLEYAGAQDHPVTPVLVSDSNDGLDWLTGQLDDRLRIFPTRPEARFVSASTLTALLAEVEKSRAMPALAGEDSFSSTSLTLTVWAPEGRSTTTLQREHAVEMLGSFTTLAPALAEPMSRLQTELGR